MPAIKLSILDENNLYIVRNEWRSFKIIVWNSLKMLDNTWKQLQRPSDRHDLLIDSVPVSPEDNTYPGVEVM